MLYLTEEWDSFDAWCLVRGIDADALTSRRLVALTVMQLTEHLEKERADTLLADLERIGNGILENTPVPPPPIPEVAPPPGWKSDNENWANIQGFLGQMGTTKKAVNRG